MRTHVLATGTGHQFINIEKLKEGNIVEHHLLYRIFSPHMIAIVEKDLLLPQEAPGIVNHGFIKYYLRSSNLHNMDEVMGFFHSYFYATTIAFNGAPQNKNEHGSRLLQYILSEEVRVGKERRHLLWKLSAVDAQQLMMIKKVFNEHYWKRLTAPAIAEKMGESVDFISAMQLCACQTFHLILSRSPL